MLLVSFTRSEVSLPTEHSAGYLQRVQIKPCILLRDFTYKKHLSFSAINMDLLCRRH